MDYKEALKHMYNVEQLNVKGLKELIKILQSDNFDLQERIITLESRLSYAGTPKLSDCVKGSGR